MDRQGHLEVQGRLTVEVDHRPNSLDPGGTCQNPVCGDGYVWAGHEECDDGNSNVNDACPDGPDGTCYGASCGDGFLWTQGGGNEELQGRDSPEKKLPLQVFVCS